MRRWLNLIIVFALIFGGGLALALKMVFESVVLFIVGLALGFFFDSRNLLPE